MNTDKGMSQVLVIIVAAAVLMMVGLLLVQVAGDNILDSDETVDQTTCQQQLEYECSQESDDEATISDQPAACSQQAWDELSDSDGYDC